MATLEERLGLAGYDKVRRIPARFSPAGVGPYTTRDRGTITVRVLHDNPPQAKDSGRTRTTIMYYTDSRDGGGIPHKTAMSYWVLYGLSDDEKARRLLAQAGIKVK